MATTNPWDFSSGSQGAEAASEWALGQAKGLLGNMATPTMPESPYGQMQAPTQTAYDVPYTAAPQYQTLGGLEGGDYNAVQAALEAPIQQQYQTGLKDLERQYAGSGLYGSAGDTLMSGAMGDLNQATQTALADATTQRYNLQMEDMARQMAEQENVAKYGLLDAERQQAYDQAGFNWDYAQDEAQRQFANEQIANQYGYDVGQYEQDISEQQRALQNLMSLSSGTQPMLSYDASQASIAAQQDAANKATEAQNTAGWLGAAGGLLGGVLSSDGFWNLF